MDAVQPISKQSRGGKSCVNRAYSCRCTTRSKMMCFSQGTSWTKTWSSSASSTSFRYGAGRNYTDPLQMINIITLQLSLLYRHNRLCLGQYGVVNRRMIEHQRYDNNTQQIHNVLLATEPLVKLTDVLNISHICYNFVPSAQLFGTAIFNCSTALAVFRGTALFGPSSSSSSMQDDG